jgi:hypothetical protein
VNVVAAFEKGAHGAKAVYRAACARYTDKVSHNWMIREFSCAVKKCAGKVLKAAVERCLTEIYGRTVIRKAAMKLRLFFTNFVK